MSDLTSNGITPGSDLPQHKSHGVDISLFKGLNVLQIDSGLEHLWSHVPRCSNLK